MMQRKIFEKMGVTTDWVLANPETNQKNSKIFHQLLSGLKESNPELFGRLVALKVRIAANEQSDEVSTAIDDLIDELKEYKEFTEPMADEDEQSADEEKEVRKAA